MRSTTCGKRLAALAVLLIAIGIVHGRESADISDCEIRDCACLKYPLLANVRVKYLWRDCGSLTHSMRSSTK